MKKGAKTIIITGGNTGLGFETAKMITKSSADWHIIIASRNPQKGEEAVRALIQSTNNPNISAMILDLSSMTSKIGRAHV